MEQVTEKTIIERQQFSRQLNGQGGQWPSQVIESGMDIYACFGTAEDNLHAIDKSAKITIAPKPGHELIGYVTLRIFERPIPESNPAPD